MLIAIVGATQADAHGHYRSVQQVHSTLHVDLQVLVNVIALNRDLYLLEGHRSDQRQALLYQQGLSLAGPGLSK